MTKSGPTGTTGVYCTCAALLQCAFNLIVPLMTLDGGLAHHLTDGRSPFQGSVIWHSKCWCCWLAEVKHRLSARFALCRLNYRLSNACEADIDNLCAAECTPFLGQACGGRVLRCLTEKQDSIESKACADEVFYFEKMEVSDFRNDVLLAEACRTDVDKYCRHVEPGQNFPIHLTYSTMPSGTVGLEGS